MTWANVDLVNINPNLELIPAKNYVFELLPGAKYDDRDPGRITANAAIVNDGEFTGRRIFFSYPDPAVKEWAPKALKRLEQALGEDAQEGEDPVAYLNRAAGSRFGAEVKHTAPTDEYPNARANLNIFSVKPSV